MSDKKHNKNNELDRLAELSSINIEIKDLYEDLEPFVQLAKYITGCSICEINVLDAYYQWSVAGYGKDIKIISRDDGICHNTIAQDEIYEIKDLSSDERYKDRDPVKNDPKLRYYCGVPLRMQGGSNIGTVCVMSSEFKVLDQKQKEQLKNIADIIIKRLELSGAVINIQAETEEVREEFHKLNHELRSPINGIVGILGMLITDEAEVTVSTKKLATVKDCANTIVEMVESVLKNIEGSDQAAEKVSLEKTVAKLDSLYRLQADQKNLSLNIQTSGLENSKALEYYITAVIQIAGNLIANSIKFTEEGGSIEVGLSKEKLGDRGGVNLIVADDGKGMSNDQVISFNTGGDMQQTEGTAGEKSYGMGLEHVKSMVEELQGSIEVSSTQEEGATFRVWLPID